MGFNRCLILLCLTNVLGLKYRFNSRHFTHSGANDYCDNYRSTLPSITTIEFNEEITEKMEEFNVTSIWINARIPETDKWSKNGFRMATTDRITSSLWAPGHPVCHIFRTGTLFSALSYIVTKGKSLSAEDCSVKATVLCSKYNEYKGWIYIANTTSMIFKEAVKYCENLGFELPSLSSSQESKNLYEKIKEFGFSNVWINVLARPIVYKPGELYRMKGNTDVLLGLWDDGQPDNETGNEFCVEINREKSPEKYYGNLNDVNCNETKPVLCVSYE